MTDLFIRRVLLGTPPDADSYLSRLPVVQSLQRQGGIDFDARITFFVGENGAGKSTLLEAVAVACGFNPEGGTRNFSFSTADSHSSLGNLLKVWRGPRRERDGFFLRAESFYNVASYIDELDSVPSMLPKLSSFYGGKSLHEQSHGESFLALALNRFGGQGLYILDEPEAALSPARQMALLARLHQLAQEGSQIIAATHSSLLMACPAAQVLLLDENGITPIPYQQTEHYTLMKSFLCNPERMLQYLLDES